MGVEVCVWKTSHVTAWSLDQTIMRKKVNLFKCFLNCTYVSVPASVHAPLLSYVPALCAHVLLHLENVLAYC